MEPREFIDFSGQIAARANTGAAGARSAVSRAYYGAFHAAAQFLEEIGCGVPANGHSHNLIPQCLQNALNDDLKTAGSLLSDLRTERNRVDYRLSQPRCESFPYARIAVETAVRIQRLIEAVLADVRADEALLEKIQVSINEYRKSRDA